MLFNALSPYFQRSLVSTLLKFCEMCSHWLSDTVDHGTERINLRLWLFDDVAECEAGSLIATFAKNHSFSSTASKDIVVVPLQAYLGLSSAFRRACPSTQLDGECCPLHLSYFFDAIDNDRYFEEISDGRCERMRQFRLDIEKNHQHADYF